MVDFSGGTINANTGEIGREGGVGVLNVSGTATLNYNQQLTIGSGTNGNGTVNQTGGAVNVNSNWFALAAGGGSSGKYITSAGTLTVLAGLEVGADGVGLLDISGTAVVTANNVAVGVRDAGVGTIKITGGRLHSNDRIALGGDQSGGKGTLDLLGGVVETRYIYAQDEAVLNLGPGTLRATGTETNFLRDFNGVGLHSAINLVGTGPTIDTAGFDVRITTSSVFSDTDASTVDGLLGTVLKKTGAGTLTIETAVDGNGTVSLQALAGITDFEASQTLDTLDIAGGAIVTLSTLASPPAPALADATIFGGSPADWHGGVISSPDNLADLGGAELAAGPAVQGVPEPGMLGLLLVSGLGLLGRRNRKGKA